MTNIKLTLACGDYDRTRALIDGRIAPEGIDLDFLVMRPREAFRRMLDGNEFDACEMSLASHAILKARGDTRFIGLPIMLSKLFRHSGMYVRTDSGIAAPQDLIGKRVGTNRYNSTGLIYMRGLLHHDYEVTSQSLRWCIGPLNEPGEKPQIPETEPPCAFNLAPPGTALEEMLESGALDAIFANEIPRLFLAGLPIVRRLFPNFKPIELDYYRRTQIFPVMHILVLRETVHRDHPHVAAALTHAFSKAKDLALAQLYDSDALHATLPFLLDHVEETRAGFGADFWAYGIEPNRPALEALGRYCHEQGLAPRVTVPEDLFATGLDAG